MHRPCLTARRGLLTALASATLALALVPGAAHAQSPDEFVPVTDEMLQDPSPGDWLMWRRTLDGWGFRNVHSVSH